MSWRIAADLREMFVEVAATDGHKTILGRTLNRKDVLLSGLSEALGLLPAEVKSRETQVIIKSDFDRISLRERWGSHTAFIGTEGFENLLEIGGQQRLNLFGLQAIKKIPLIPREAAFGITERTRGDGSIEVELNDTEIDFVISKLELAEIKTVAVCFLHSNVNAQHEKQLEKKLVDRGFEVVCSHLFRGHERERAEKACAEAFLKTGRRDMIEDLVKMGFAVENIKVDSPYEAPESAPVKKISTLEDCFFLEDRILIGNQQLKNISPLSEVQLEDGGHVHFSPAPTEAEPGPISFGKGIQLCLLDLLLIAAKASPHELPRLKFDLGRALKQLAPLAKQLRTDTETCLNQFINLSAVVIADEILTIEAIGSQKRAVTASSPPSAPPAALNMGGWLAPLLGPPVSRHLGRPMHKKSGFEAWQSSLDLLQEYGGDIRVAFGDFKFAVLPS